MNLELRWAVRTLSRNKRFSVSALVTFALAISAAVTVFSVVDAVLLRPATFPNPGSVISVQYAEKRGDWDAIPPDAFRQIEQRGDLFPEAAGCRIELFTVTHVPAPDQVFGLSVSGQYFKMLAPRPLMGRLLLPADDRAGAPGVALLSFRGWQKLFKSDPGVLGKTAEIDRRFYTIVGVLPADFVAPGENTAGVLWTALRLTQAELGSPEARKLQVYARVRQGVTAARVKGFLNQLASSLQSSAGQDHRPIYLRSEGWHEGVESSQKYILWLAMGMTFGPLLIGCSNVASILLARGIRSSRDYTIRLATGASRGQIMRQSLLEIAILASVGCVIACIFTSVSLQFIRTYLSGAGTGIPNITRIHLSAYSVLFASGIALLSAMLCGLLPALLTTRIDLSTGLRETGTKVAGGRSARGFLCWVVGIQACIAMLLLLSSGLLVRSLARLISDDHGLRPDHVLTLRLPTGSWDASDPGPGGSQPRLEQYLRLLERAQRTHGVEAAALASSLPLSHTVTRTRLKAPDFMASADRGTIMPICQAVTRDYFRVMGIPVLSGRTFDSFDSASKARTGVINEAFRRKYFGRERPIGHFVYDPERSEGIQVIGVVKDSPHLDYADPVEPEIYLNFEQDLMTPFLTGLVVRTLGDPQQLGNALRSALAMDNQAVVHVQTFQNLIADNTWQPRFSAWLFSCFAAVALCLSGIGIYGVTSYVTASSKHDYGIRLSLGAQPIELFRVASIQSLRPVLTGISIGALGSYWTSKWMASLLYHTSPFDLTTVSITIAILLAVALAAIAGPALNTARVDPAITLRHG